MVSGFLERFFLSGREFVEVVVDIPNVSVFRYQFAGPLFTYALYSGNIV